MTQSNQVGSLSVWADLRKAIVPLVAATLLAGLVSGIAAPLVFRWLTRPKYELSYELSARDYGKTDSGFGESIEVAFDGKAIESPQILFVRIANTGSEHLVDVPLSIRFGDAARIVHGGLATDRPAIRRKTQMTITDDAVHVVLPVINRSDVLTMAFLTDGATNDSVSLDTTYPGLRLVARERSASRTESRASLWIRFGALLFLVGSLFWLAQRLRTVTSQVNSDLAGLATQVMVGNAVHTVVGLAKYLIELDESGELRQLDDPLILGLAEKVDEANRLVRKSIESAQQAGGDRVVGPFVSENLRWAHRVFRDLFSQCAERGLLEFHPDAGSYSFTDREHNRRTGAFVSILESLIQDDDQPVRVAAHEG